MLKLTYTPTSEINRLDPNSQWKRKDGAVCTLIVCDGMTLDYPWLLVLDGRTVANPHEKYRHHFNAAEMLAWLRRDFERVGERDVGEMKSVELVPVGNMFIYDKKRYIKGCDRTCSERRLICWGFDHSGASYFGDSAIVRDLGPIEIDDSVKGVG